MAGPWEKYAKPQPARPVEPGASPGPWAKYAAPAEEAPQKPSSFPGAAVIEPVATMATGMVAEPVAGITGAVAAAAPTRPASVWGEAFGEPEEIGPAGADVGAEVVEATRRALTKQPGTEEGKRGLQAVGEVLEPVGKVMQAAETFMGDEAFKATGSPALAAAATTIPTALMEVLGLKFIRGAKRTKQLAKDKSIMKAVVESAPDIDTLKNVSRSVYKELDDLGVSVNQNAFNRMTNNIRKEVVKRGFDPDLTPDTAAVLKRLNKERGFTQSLSEIDKLRQLAQNAAKSPKPADAALGSVIINNIDDFLDTATPKDFFKGASKVNEIMPKYKVARELWGRARRSELINEAFEKAMNQASGFENGVVTQFRSILNNKKKIRFFKPEEVKIMRDVVRGTTPANMAKLVGKLGFSEGHATNILGGLAGAAGGAAVFGAPGAVAVPVIGQVSRKLAQKLTRANAELADIIVRAGPDARKIATAYISKIPKSQRSAVELSELFMRPDIALDKLVLSKNALMKEAAEIAKGRRVLAAAGVFGAGGLGAIKELEGEQPQ